MKLFNKNEFKLGQLFCPKAQPDGDEIVAGDAYYVVFQEQTDKGNLIFLSLNSKSQPEAKTIPFYEHPHTYFEPTQITAMDLMQDMICIKVTGTGLIGYGKAVGFTGANRLVTFSPLEDGMESNIEFEIQGILGTRYKGQLFYNHQPYGYF